MGCYIGAPTQLVKPTKIVFFVGYALVGMSFPLSSFFLLVLVA
jgi:hypothetical protein